jgi:hypothetical protein
MPYVLAHFSKMKIIYKILLLLPVISLLLVTAGKTLALAQTDNETASFQNVHLWINPEYDDPRLLIMIEGQIAGVQPPAMVRFLVPSDAEMYSAGSKDAQGNYTGGPPERKPSSIPGWDEISYEVKTNTFRVEYYTTSITGQPDKAISYEFLRFYPIDSLLVIIQQPRLATNFTISPAGQPYVDVEGFNTYVYSYSGLAVDTPIRFQISYTKSDPRPSQDIKGNPELGSLLSVIILVMFGIAVVGTFFWIKKSKNKNRNARRQPVRHLTTPGPNVSQLKTRFCEQCGKPIEGSHKFCPDCGAKISRRT